MTPKTVVLTGASDGIGAASARQLAASGHRLILVGRSIEKTRAVAADTGAEWFTADFARLDDVRELATKIADAVGDGGIDVLVHAAGIMVLSPLAELELDDLDRMHRTNIRGTFVVVQQAARRVRPGGAIVTFSTSVVALAFPNYGAYSASKGAVEALTLILARELRGRDVTANAVAPGPIWTPLIPATTPKEKVDDFGTEESPMGRADQPAEVAPMYVFLASQESSYVNGEVIGVTGGMPLS